MKEFQRGWIIAIVLWVLLLVLFRADAPSDFLAVYMAGKAFAVGDFASVYGPPVEMFSLDVPQSWAALAQQAGLDAEATLYPYIYPPIWAALFGSSLSLLPPQSLYPPLYALNAALMVGTVALAWKASGAKRGIVLWLLIGVLFLATTSFGFIALRQGQWQILTSFLIVLSLERARAGAPHQAGIALAFATSIKLYPVLLVVLWLARRDQWRNIPSFAVTALLITGASLALAGVDLHMQFLDRIATISGSVLYTLLSYNLTVLLDGWTVDIMPEEIGIKLVTPWVGTLNKVLLLASAAAVFLAARRATPNQYYQCLVPIWLVAMSYFSPLSWSYHFITAMAFAPLLMEHGWRSLGPWAYLAIFLIASLLGLFAISAIAPVGMVLVCTGSLTLLILVLALIWQRPRAEGRADDPT
jgi:hypothetical protein